MESQQHSIQILAQCFRGRGAEVVPLGKDQVKPPEVTKSSLSFIQNLKPPLNPYLAGSKKQQHSHTQPHLPKYSLHLK